MTRRCPKCRDICNCSRCRKLKGGIYFSNLTNAVRNAGAGSVAQILQGDPKAEGILPGKGVQTDKKLIKPPKPAISVDVPPKVRAPRKKQPKVKPMPTVSWTRLRVNIPVSEVEARMHIREFVLRFFSSETSISRAHLEELGEIAGKGRGRDDDEDMVGWVSDGCVKSVILRLLDILAEQEVNAGIQKVGDLLVWRVQLRADDDFLQGHQNWD